MEKQLKMNCDKNSYINIGGNYIIASKDIIGIFDIDKITVFKNNRIYLSNIEKRGKIVNVAEDLPKSCIVCCGDESENETVYLSPLLTSTLMKRSMTNLLDL